METFSGKFPRIVSREDWQNVREEILHYEWWRHHDKYGGEVVGLMHR